MIQAFFETGHISKEMNASFISLIPKTLNPTTPAEFRPIALVNTSYKIISKLMAGRMKGLLDKIISPYQSAFIPGREISDNITKAHELIHKMRNKRGKNGLMGIKIDMSKAFDRVEWSFLIQILKKIGFSKKWCNLIHECISTTTLAVLINGSPTGFFKPTRGLRQGDPISPYLFLFCMEALSRTIMNAEHLEKIKGIKITPSAPTISHLLFADDCLIFCDANVTTSQKLVQLFTDFGTASGQLINLSKSGVFFSTKTTHNIRKEVTNVLGVQAIPLNDKYLGSPLFTNKSKIKSFEPLIEKMKNRLLSWDRKDIYTAGRTVIVKNVASSLCVYQMNCFKIPVKICKTITKLQRNFWWGKMNMV